MFTPILSNDYKLHNTGPSGTFTSPNYPEDYPNFSICEWMILGGPGRVIALSFLDFNLQEPELACNDIVMAYEGTIISSQYLFQ